MKESKLKSGDYIKVVTPDEEHLGEYQGRDDHYLCLKGEGEFIFVPNGDVVIIRKPFVTVPENQAP